MVVSTVNFSSEKFDISRASMIVLNIETLIIADPAITYRGEGIDEEENKT